MADNKMGDDAHRTVAIERAKREAERGNDYIAFCELVRNAGMQNRDAKVQIAAWKQGKR